MRPGWEVSSAFVRVIQSHPVLGSTSTWPMLGKKYGATALPDVFGLKLTSWPRLGSVNQNSFSGASQAIPTGASPNAVKNVWKIAPVFGTNSPMALMPVSVNQTLPSLSTANWLGSGSG